MSYHNSSSKNDKSFKDLNSSAKKRLQRVIDNKQQIVPTSLPFHFVKSKEHIEVNLI